MSKFIVLDTETTGIDEEDRIIQLGYMVLGKPNEPIEVYNEYNSTDSVKIKITAMEVHNITPEIIEGKPKLKETNGFIKLNELNLEDNIMVIHNSPFDLKMLEKEGFQSNMKLIDTLVVSKHLFPDSESQRLQFYRYKMGLYKLEEEEAKKLNIQVNAHDAIGDVLVLKLFMKELIKEVKKQFPNDNPIEKLIQLTKEIPILKKVPFGKYYNQPIEEVLKTDRGWFEWALKNIEDLSEEFKYSVEYWLNKPKENHTVETKVVQATTNKFMD